ncbi:MAG: Ig-like domain-containing protein [Promethearchaeota archaeon]
MKNLIQKLKNSNKELKFIILLNLFLVIVFCSDINLFKLTTRSDFTVFESPQLSYSDVSEIRPQESIMYDINITSIGDLDIGVSWIEDDKLSIYLYSVTGSLLIASNNTRADAGSYYYLNITYSVSFTGIYQLRIYGSEVNESSVISYSIQSNHPIYKRKFETSCFLRRGEHISYTFEAFPFNTLITFYFVSDISDEFGIEVLGPFSATGANIDHDAIDFYYGSYNYSLNGGTYLLDITLWFNSPSLNATVNITSNFELIKKTTNSSCLVHEAETFFYSIDVDVLFTSTTRDDIYVYANWTPDVNISLQLYNSFGVPIGSSSDREDAIYLFYNRLSFDTSTLGTYKLGLEVVNSTIPLNVTVSISCSFNLTKITKDYWGSSEQDNYSHFKFEAEPYDIISIYIYWFDGNDDFNADLYDQENAWLRYDWSRSIGTGIYFLNFSYLVTVAGFYRLSIFGEFISDDGNFNITSTHDLQNVSSTDVKPPMVRIDFPYENSFLGGIVPVQVFANDANGTQKVEFYIDDILQYTDLSAPFGWNWDTSLFTDEYHILEVIAYDDSSNHNTNSTSISVLVDNIPPQITITSPNNDDQVWETITISFSASDLSGIVNITIFIDSEVLETVYGTPYESQWDTTAYSNGVHTIRAVATDGSILELTNYDEINVNVQNEGDGGSTIQGFSFWIIIGILSIATFILVKKRGKICDKFK